jgi:transcriptional regulator with AAA-type ATPase domain
MPLLTQLPKTPLEREIRLATATFSLTCRPGAYHWQGNIRELQNVIQRAVILFGAQTPAVEEACLPPKAAADQPFNSVEPGLNYFVGS